MDQDLAERVANVLKAVAHPVRLQIVDILCNGRQSVGELSELVGQQQAIVSQHRAAELQPPADPLASSLELVASPLLTGALAPPYPTQQPDHSLEIALELVDR